MRGLIQLAYIAEQKETKKGLKIKITYTPPEKRHLPANNRRSHKTLIVKDMAEAQSVLNRYQAIEDGEIIDITVQNAVEDWKNYEIQQRLRSKSTYEEYFKLVDEWVRLTNSYKTKLSEINLAKMRYYFEHVAFKARKDGEEGELSSARKIYHFSALSAFFEYCTDRMYCEMNYIKFIKRPKRVYEAVELPEREEVEDYIVKAIRALQQEDNKELELIFRLILETGMRISEVRALEWKAINFKTNILEVSQSLEKNGDIKPTKNKQIYKMKITDQLANMLQEYKNEKLNDINKSKNHFIFCSDEDGKPYRSDSMTRKWQRFRERHDLTTFNNGLSASFHKFRHYNATVLFEEIFNLTENADLTLRLVQERLGHTSKEITEKIYVHYVPAKDDSQAYEAINNVMNQIENLLAQSEE